MPAFVWRLDVTQNTDIIPKLAGLAFAQFAKFPFVAPGLLATALDDALFSEGIDRKSVV